MGLFEWKSAPVAAKSTTTKKVIVEMALFGMSQVAFYLVFRYFLSSLGGMDSARKRESRKKSEALLKRLKLEGGSKLTEHEHMIMAEVIASEDIKIGFSDIGGLDDIVDSLKETVIYPLVYPEIFRSKNNSNDLLGPPKGVLLYGPPGCGKTMLAKALAHESGATFINMRVSTLTDKWFGESNKLVAALFSLANKLQPCIIFIDEIDAFLRERGKGDHEVTAMIKAEFMTLWDGLLSSSENNRIIVLGATNRPNDIDSAILRRMPKRYAVKLPNLAQRRKIFDLLLKDTKLEDSGSWLPQLVAATEGCSGSDIKEICRHAVMAPVREHLREHGVAIARERNGEIETRGVRLTDFLERLDRDEMEETLD